MKQIIDFGDVITIKIIDFLNYIQDINPEAHIKISPKLDNIDYLKYTMKKNDLGMSCIYEEAFSNENKLINIQNKHEETIISHSDIFNLLSLKKGSLLKNQISNFIPNDINTKVQLSEKKSVSDGDVMQISMNDFINILKNSQQDDYSHVEEYQRFSDFGFNKILLSFHYEDERYDAFSLNRKYDYNYDCKPNPYIDIFVDVYIFNDELNFFKNYTNKKDTDKIKHDIYMNKRNYLRKVEYFENNEKDDFEKTIGFKEKIDFYREYSERFRRYDHKILKIIKESHDIDNKITLIGNFRNNENTFINTEEIIRAVEISKQNNIIRPRRKM